MKRIFVVAFMLALAFTVSAQPAGGGQRPAGGGGFQQTPEQIAANLETMKKELSLNDKQFDDFKKIDEEYNAKMAATLQSGNFDRDAMTKMREEQTTKIKAVLTADQFKKYEELQAQRMQRGPGGAPGGGGPR